MWPVIFCSLKIIYKFRIKHSRSEPSVISASEPEVGVGRFAPLGSSVNDCRTWAPFLISDTFFALFRLNFKTGHFSNKAAGFLF